MICEVTIEELLSDYDWEEVFGEGDRGNCNDEVVSYDGTPCDRVTRSMVGEIIAAVNGEGDGVDWCGLFKLTDGRYLAASGGCCYTGWDCQAGNNLTVASTLDNAAMMGLDSDQRERLQYVAL